MEYEAWSLHEYQDRTVFRAKYLCYLIYKTEYK